MLFIHNFQEGSHPPTHTHALLPSQCQQHREMLFILPIYFTFLRVATEFRETVRRGAFILQKITGIPISFVFYNGRGTKPERTDHKVCQKTLVSFSNRRNHFSIIKQKQHREAITLLCLSCKVLQPAALRACYGGLCLSKQMEQQLALICLLLRKRWPNEANAPTRFFILLS